MLKTFFSFLLGFICLPIILLILHLWSFGALFYSPIQPSVLRITLAVLYGAGIPLVILVLRSRKWAVILPLAGFLCVFVYEWKIQPKTNAVYQPQVAKTAYAEFQGEKIIFHNIRNSDYRTPNDFDVRWETREYDLKDLRTLDVLVNYWGMDVVAHVFVSFGFTNSRYLAVSIEYRPEVGESYGMFKGLFKKYEIIYVWADERDVTRLRTNYRMEDIYLYRTDLAPDRVRKLFLSMIERTNELHQKPEFYNTVTESCTNTIGNHIIKARIVDLSSWKRRLLTGDIDRRLYEGGFLVTGNEPFSELRAQSKINERARTADRDPQFSEKIRSHLSGAVSKT